MNKREYKKPLTRQERHEMRKARIEFIGEWLKLHETPKDRESARPLAAEMKRAGLYSPTTYEYDIAGFALGIVEEIDVCSGREIEHQERQLLATIDERDAAEESLSQAYFLVIGHSPEWSNCFGHADALREIECAVFALRMRARLIAAAPDMLAALRALVAAGRVPQLSSLPNTDTELSRAARMTYAAIAKATGDSESNKEQM